MLLRRLIPRALRRRLFDAIKAGILRDRAFQEQLKVQLECLDVEEQLFGDAPRLEDREALLRLAARYASRQSTEGDLWMEFGVWKGGSINLIAQQVTHRVYGFDSFEGLPEPWRLGRYHVARRGACDLHGKPPPVAANVRLITGPFQETLRGFLSEHTAPAAFVHIDCDLYTSTKYVLEHVRLRDGSVVVFDEYFNFPFWREGEYKAFREYLESHQTAAECIGYAPSAWCAAFVLRRSN